MAITNLKPEWGVRYKIKAQYFVHSEGSYYKTINILEKKFSPVPFVLKGQLDQLSVKQLKQNQYRLYNNLEIIIKNKTLAKIFRKLIKASKKEKLTFTRQKNNNLASSRKVFELHFENILDRENKKIKNIVLKAIIQKIIKSDYAIEPEPCDPTKRGCEKILTIEPYKYFGTPLKPFFKENINSSYDTNIIDKTTFEPKWGYRYQVKGLHRDLNNLQVFNVTKIISVKFSPESFSYVLTIQDIGKIKAIDQNHYLLKKGLAVKTNANIKAKLDKLIEQGLKITKKYKDKQQWGNDAYQNFDFNFSFNVDKTKQRIKGIILKSIQTK